MAKTIPIIGIAPDELPWIRILVGLLRHPDAGVAELARQALLYLSDAAANPRPDRCTPHKGAG
jgi:hypothetical protein